MSAQRAWVEYHILTFIVLEGGEKVAALVRGPGAQVAWSLDRYGGICKGVPELPLPGT